MDHLELNAKDIGIVVGTDHWSLPSAIRLLYDAGIRDVLHAPGPYYRHESAHGWGHMRLDKSSTQLDADGLVKLVKRRANHAVFGGCVFTLQGIEWLEGMLSYPRERADNNIPGPSCPDSLLGVPLAFVPAFPAGAVTVTPSTAMASEIAWTELPFSITLDQSCDRRMIVSPGNCRQHTYCTCNMESKMLTWHAGC